jgi:hypothetical protein
MGYRLVIVTARTQDVVHASWGWVDRHFPRESTAWMVSSANFQSCRIADLFDSIICTEQFKEAAKSGHEIMTKLSKAQACLIFELYG